MITKVREEILKAYDFSVENNMSDSIIRLYILGEDDIDIWKEKGFFYYSIGFCKYGELEGLLDDLCKDIESNNYVVTNVEIE